VKPGVPEHRVFLNYPFESAFEPFAEAMHFAVVASNLIPQCAKDFTSPDQPRLETLVEAILGCHYSIHDFSLIKGEGPMNYARMNMSIEMGMALFHALQTQRRSHRCAFFVVAPYEYQIAASDLAGLDPISYTDPESMLLKAYEWFRDTIRSPLTSPRTGADIKAIFQQYRTRKTHIVGSEKDGHLSHAEFQELIFQVCSENNLWDWRDNKAGQVAFPPVPLATGR
jgi:hypothetical protein